MSFTPWTHRPGPAVMQAGLTADQAESRGDASYDRMLGPPCVACGQPVKDADYRRHLFERHGQNEQCQPWGEPDAREALFLAHSRPDLESKVSRWRVLHPGVRLLPYAEGTRYGGLMIWVRFRIADARGRLAR